MDFPVDPKGGSHPGNVAGTELLCIPHGNASATAEKSLGADRRPNACMGVLCPSMSASPIRLQGGTSHPYALGQLCNYS